MSQGGDHSTRFDAWFKFYPSDWLGNMRLRRLSDETKAIILDLMCYAHTNKPYGSILNAASNAASIGRSERALRTAISEAISAGVIHPMPDSDGFFPFLVRDRQKCLAGLASAAVRNGRWKQRSEPQNSGLRTQSLDIQRVEKCAPGRADGSERVPRRGGTELTRWWDSEYQRTRGVAFDWVATMRNGKRGASPDAVALGNLQGQFPVDEIKRRITRFCESKDPFEVKNCTPRIFASRYATHAVSLQARSKSESSLDAVDSFTRDTAERFGGAL